MRTISFLLGMAAFAIAQTSVVSYDVSGICSEVRASPAPRMGFAEPAPLMGGVGQSEGSGEEDLASLISAVVDPVSWQNPDVSMERSPGRLIVRQAPEVQAHIADFLALLELHCERAIFVGVEIVALSPGVAADLALQAGPLTPEKRAALDAALADPARGVRLHDLSVSLRAGQCGHQAALRRRTVIAGRETFVESGAKIEAPLQGHLDEGATLEVLPSLGRNGTVTARIQVVVSRILSVDTVDLPAAGGGPLSLPVESIFEARTCVIFPEGQPVVLALGPAGPERQGWTMAAVAAARVESGSANAKVHEIAGMRFFDVGALLAHPGNYWPHEVGVPRKPEATPPSASDPIPDEDFARSPSLLVDLLHVQIPAAAWDNGEIVTRVVGDLLLVKGSAENLDTIGKYLARLEGELSVGAATDAWVLAFSPADWSSRRDVLQRPGGLTDELFGEVLDAVNAGRGRLVGAASALGMTGARGFVASGTRRRLVSSWNVEVASGVAAAAPEILPADDGLVLAFHPATGPAGSVVPGIHGAWARLDPPHPVEGASKPWPIFSIAGDSAEFRAEFALTEGRTILVATALVGEEGKQEVMVFLVRARTFPLR